MTLKIRAMLPPWMYGRPSGYAYDIAEYAYDPATDQITVVPIAQIPFESQWLPQVPALRSALRSVFRAPAWFAAGIDSIRAAIPAVSVRRWRGFGMDNATIRVGRRMLKVAWR